MSLIFVSVPARQRFVFGRRAIGNAARLDGTLTNEVGTKNVPYAESFASFDISVDGVMVSVVLNLNSEIGLWVESLLREELLYWAEGK